MKRIASRSCLPLLLAVALCPRLAADTIHTLDGKSIVDATVISESVTEVVYRVDRAEARLASDKVLSIEFSKKPKLVDEGDAAVGDGDIGGALASFEAYLEEVLGTDPEKRFKWAPAYAAKRVVELKLSLGETSGAIAAADALLKNFPDSRYAPEVFLAKVGALTDVGETTKAQAALRDFKKLIDDKQLSPGWVLEHQLAGVQVDDKLTPVARRDALLRVMDAAKQFPLVRNRAWVYLGESHLAEATPEASEAVRAKALEAALKVFEGVIADPAADQGTLAAAYTGLGDCLFQAAAGKKDLAGLREAVLAYLRVVELYPEQSRYVAKCLFLAGRAMQLQETPESRGRAVRLHDRCIRDFPDSDWAKKSADFRGK